MSIQIKHPKHSNTAERGRAVPGVVVAAGIIESGDPEIVSVTGAITKLGTQEVHPPKDVWIHTCPDGIRHWAMRFGSQGCRISAGQYTLLVQGLTVDGEHSGNPDRVDFESHGVWNPPFIGINYPADGADITDDYDYFVAYGPLQVHDAISAVMQGQANVGSSSLYSSVEYGFWSAVFPELQLHTDYKLVVVDSAITHMANISLHTL